MIRGVQTLTLKKEDPEASAIAVSEIVGSMTRQYLDMLGNDPKAVAEFTCTLLARVAGMTAGILGGAETAQLLEMMKGAFENGAPTDIRGRRH